MHKILLSMITCLSLLYIYRLVTQVLTACSPTIGHHRIAFISSNYGGYEKTCKSYTPQNADFIFFTDNPTIQSNCWQIDTTPYHFLDNPIGNNGAFLNSMRNNRNPFNIAKYYKQQFHRIPRLRQYDIIVWLDATIQLRDNHGVTAADFFTGLFHRHTENNKSPIAFEHELRHGEYKMRQEMRDSATNGRYETYNAYGMQQPFQNVTRQYEDYIQMGYNDNEYWSSIQPHRAHRGMW